ncbi:hypothetical protein AWB69_03489 [Caballeronia udeis]|uniref:Uncharacterized protein n=1 Tax=Caballeronia udeis TaxID=1232866 RepID=A0A158GWA7_9BURK|nr:hypothetical protein AWB69_03489 [Caballeronia udeis]
MSGGSQPLYEPVAGSVSSAATPTRRLQLGIDGKAIEKGSGHITGSMGEACWQFRAHDPPLVTSR